MISLELFCSGIQQPAIKVNQNNGCGGSQTGTKAAVAIVVILLTMAVISGIGLGVYFGVYGELLMHIYCK